MKKLSLLLLSLIFASSLFSCNGNFNNDEKKIASIQLVKDEFSISSLSNKLKIQHQMEMIFAV